MSKRSSFHYLDLPAGSLQRARRFYKTDGHTGAFEDTDRNRIALWALE